MPLGFEQPMKFDIFFSISHTPADGLLPTEAEMFCNFFRQVEVADELGYRVAWIAESHLSSETQKQNRGPVIPHFKGEVGLNVDLCQLAHLVFARTKRIECGSAVMNILCNGGPIAAAERVSSFCALHGVNLHESRRLHVGFAAGRFEFMNRAYGIDARGPIERAAWPALKGKVFREAAHIFLRLLQGEVLSSLDSPETVLRRSDFRSDEDWQSVLAAAGQQADEVPIARRFEFEELKIVPQDWRRELLVPVVGSHDPLLQQELNQIMPVQVFNLSITDREVIENTHLRMRDAYHRDGGQWQREYMPRTVMVFIDQDEAKAKSRAERAIGEYWNALEGTIDPAKVAAATENALCGTPTQIIDQVGERFDQNDRLMLWFDFHDHQCQRVIDGISAFADEVAPAFE